MKIKYRPTPLNIISGLASVFVIYLAMNSGPMGFGILGLIYFTPIIIIGILIDFILQKYFSKYLITFCIEIFILSIIYFAYCWSQRSKTLIIPDKLQNQYIVTIYGVEKADKLPSGWNYEIKIPTNGVFMTSSSFEDDLKETKIKTYSGININTDETELGWVDIMSDEFYCNGKIYQYQFWMVDTSCCIYSSTEIDNFKIALQKQFCK